MSAKLKFDFEWRITLFTVLLLPLLISLGFWQLQRADEKELLAAAFEHKQLQPPAPLSGLGNENPEALAYLSVKLSGHYRDDESFLLDNRMQQGKYGNEVLTLFELDNGELALVNRGWVAADPSRQQLPQVPSVPGLVEIRGHIYVAPGEPYLLAEQQLGHDWPVRVQAVEIDKMAVVATGDEEGLFPYPVRLEAGQAGALSVDWQVINVSPDKHRGYAVQWFSMALALALIYLLRSSNLWQILRGAPAGAAGDE